MKQGSSNRNDFNDGVGRKDNVPAISRCFIAGDGGLIERMLIDFVNEIWCRRIMKSDGSARITRSARRDKLRRGNRVVKERMTFKEV
jgi:hypothetical protein